MSSSFQQQATASGINRRSFLVGATFTAIGAWALAGCGVPTTVNEGVGVDLGAILPDYIPVEYVKPAYPTDAAGSTPIFTEIPSKRVQSVTEVPGAGSTITTMMALYTAIPPTLEDGNEYFAYMNEKLGANMVIGGNDASAYADKIATVLASPANVADWTSIPVGQQPPRFGEAIEANFADLTPFLAGDKVEAYPNLANILTDTWRYCVFNGKLMSIPFTQETVANAVFYRKDIFDAEGVDVPTSADELLEVARSLTDPSKNRWGSDNIWTGLSQIFRIPLQWRIDGSDLVHRYETEEYALALEFNAKMFAEGVVHPDAMAGTGNNKTRFNAGNTAIYYDGIGGWRSAWRVSGQANPEFDMQAFPVFAHDGGKPTVWKYSTVNMNNFFKKGTPPEKIEEMLRIANFLAAPFGTTEYDDVNFGKEGVHYSRNELGAPVQNEKGITEIAFTYLFLGAPDRADTDVAMPYYQESFAKWTRDAATHLVRPDFFGQPILVPGQFAALGRFMTDFEADVFNGRKTVADLPAQLDEWRAQGGDGLRDYFKGVQDELGDAAIGGPVEL